MKQLFIASVILWTRRVLLGIIFLAPLIIHGQDLANESSTTTPFEILVDNFDEGETEGVYYMRKNSLGFYQGAWSKRPSYTLISKSD